jgi:hypothetical protein
MVVVAAHAAHYRCVCQPVQVIGSREGGLSRVLNAWNKRPTTELCPREKYEDQQINPKNCATGRIDS